MGTMDAHCLPRPHAQSLRGLAAGVFIALLGLTFVVLGIHLAMQTRANPAEVLALRLFGIRDAFLGAYALLLLGRRETQALTVFLTATVCLPVADTVALAGPLGWVAAARSNLPFEAPLLIALALIPSAKEPRA